jgi:hypothetical protein
MKQNYPYAYLIRHHAMKTYGEWKYSSTILDLGTRWRQVISFTPRPLYHRKEQSVPIGWMGSRVGLGAVEKRKTSLDGNRTSTVQPVAFRYID